MSKCIWCKVEHSTTDIEHIIPESLGCPERFILSNGEVCKQCNNSLAALDQAILNDLDFFAFVNGIPRKGKRPPQISCRGNVVAYRKDYENIIFFNLSKTEKVVTDGIIVSPFRKTERNIWANFGGDEVSFTLNIGRDPKFVRGILKIAFNSVVYFLGSETFLRGEYDSIRNFVKQGKGNREIIMFPSQKQDYKNEVKLLILGEDPNEYGILLRLAAIDFLIDLSPSLKYFPIFKGKAEELWGKSGWAFLPVM